MGNTFKDGNSRHGPMDRLRDLLDDPFSRRIVLWVGVLIAMAWVMLGVDVWRQRAHRIEDAQAQAAGVVKAMSGRVQRIFGVVDQSLKVIEQGLQADVSNLGPEQRTRHLRQHAPHLEAILTIAFDDASGRRVAQSNPDLPTGGDYSNQDSFRAHVTNPALGTYVGLPIVDPGSGQNVFTVSRRVSDRSGKFVGVVTAPLRANVFAAAFDPVRIGQHGVVQLVHIGSGRVVARQPDYEATFASSLGNDPVLSEVARQSSGNYVALSMLDGRQRHFRYSGIEGMPLAIAVGVSVDDIDTHLWHDVIGYVLLAVFLSIVAAVGALVIIAAHRRELSLLAALAEKDALIGAFFSASPVGMYMLDKDLRYRIINSALARINGIPVEETVGKTTREIVPGLAAQLEPVYRHIAATGEPRKDVEISGEIEARPGETGYWTLSNFPIHDSRGNWLGIGGVVMDVTERKQAELALRRWQDIFEHADWGVAVGSADGTRLELVNPAYARMHGYEVEELIGQPIELVYAPEARKDIPANIAMNHEQGHRRFESLHLHRDGHTFPALIDATTVRNDAGEVLYRVVNVQDITSMRRVQEETRIAREFFQNIFDRAPVGMAITELDGHYIRVNRAMCEFVGYTETDLLEMAFQDLTHAEDLEPNMVLRRRMLAGDIDSFRMEKRYIHKDGRSIWALLVVSGVADEQGKLVYTISQMVDIDQRKRAEEALKSKDLELREALRVGRIGSWELDAETRAVTWSEQLCLIIGHDPSHPIPEKNEIPRYYKPESLDRHRSVIEHAIASGESYELEIEVILAGGHPGWLVVCGEAVRDSGGKVVRLRGTAQDITERKKWELALERTQERLRALSTYQETMLEEERKRIAREVHDELGQFLTALKMDISLLRLRFGDDPELRGKAEEMRILVEQTIQVVRHVASNLRPAALDLGLVPAIEWLAEDFGHRWEISSQVALTGGEISLDDIRATAVFRIVQESLTNIARHASASRVTISLEKGDRRLLVRVADNGCGFDPAVVAMKRGFGLLGMRERAIALGGKMQIESTVGNGTTVSIDLPLMDSRT